MISPQSAEVLQQIGRTRRMVQYNTDLDADTLRHVLLTCLEAAEELALALNQLEEAARQLVDKYGKRT